MKRLVAATTVFLALIGAGDTQAQVTPTTFAGLQLTRQSTGGLGTMDHPIQQATSVLEAVSPVSGDSGIPHVVRGIPPFLSLDIHKEMREFRRTSVLKRVMPELRQFGLAVRLGLRLEL